MWLLYRRTWRGSIFGSFAQPVLFLVAMGIGLGGFVDASNNAAHGRRAVHRSSSRRRCSCRPSCRAPRSRPRSRSSAGSSWNRRYHAMYATPLTPYAIAFGQIAWIATRATMVGGDLLPRDHRCSVRRARPGSCWSIPVGTLTGLAFAAPIAAYMTTQRDTTAFNSIWRFGITPLFLFSGTFFPIDQLPDGLRRIAWMLPAVARRRPRAGAERSGRVAEEPLISPRPPRDPRRVRRRSAPSRCSSCSAGSSTR